MARPAAVARGLSVPIRRRAVAAAAQLLVELLEHGAPAEPVEVTVTDGAVEVRVVVGKSQQVSAGIGSIPVTPARLTALDRRILAVATRDEVTMVRLAHLCGHDADSYFRERVKRLVTLGRLITEFGGYRQG